ncbi:Hypothetical protein POVR2_LOCUS203 [uncultured virus]|nr:Hypothetical protein POVR2_LOCUS203 [uncultured virus]
MQSEFFIKNTFEFGERTRRIVLPDSDDQSHLDHSIRIVNKAETELVVKTSAKAWRIAPKASASFSYDGSNWTRKVTKVAKQVACPPRDDDSCSDSESEEDDCKRGPRGPPGRDGCPGANGLNGYNGKPGRCECKNSQNLHFPYVSGAPLYLTTVQAPCWAKTAIITAVGGGGAGGAANQAALIAGPGGSSGFSITQVVPISGGFLSLSIGQGGRAATASNGNPTVVTYTGTLPYAVYAPGGETPVTVPTQGQYGGGGGDGTVPSLPGTGFEDGDPATPGVKGGDGGGYLPGIGGPSLITSTPTYGGGGGGSAPGPIAGRGGNGGGYFPATPATQLNGTSGTYGGGGGGAGVSVTSIPVGVAAGNGGDGYVNVTFIC